MGKVIDLKGIIDKKRMPSEFCDEDSANSDLDIEVMSRIEESLGNLARLDGKEFQEIRTLGDKFISFLGQPREISVLNFLFLVTEGGNKVRRKHLEALSLVLNGILEN